MLQHAWLGLWGSDDEVWLRPSPRLLFRPLSPPFQRPDPPARVRGQSPPGTAQSTTSPFFSSCEDGSGRARYRHGLARQRGVTLNVLLAGMHVLSALDVCSVPHLRNHKRTACIVYVGAMLPRETMDLSRLEALRLPSDSDMRASPFCAINWGSDDEVWLHLIPCCLSAACRPHLRECRQAYMVACLPMSKLFRAEGHYVRPNRKMASRESNCSPSLITARV